MFEMFDAFSLEFEHPSSINSATIFSSTSTKYSQIATAAPLKRSFSVRFDKFLMCSYDFFNEVDLIHRTERIHFGIDGRN
jgi:hypothetical protein